MRDHTKQKYENLPDIKRVREEREKHKNKVAELKSRQLKVKQLDDVRG